MKKLLLIGLVLFTFCSCATNYPQMVKDRVEQYQNEGKVILSQSNDDTGKKHYVVYGDIDKQTIVVDTLGENVFTIQLGKKTLKTLTPNVIEDDGLSVSFEQQEGDFNQLDVQLSKDGDFILGSVPTEFMVYEDKYIVLSKDYPKIIFLNKNDAYYDLGGSCKVDEDGNLDVTLTAMFTGILPDNWQDYTGEPEIYPDLYIDREHEDFLYKLTIAPNGKIIKKGDSHLWWSTNSCRGFWGLVYATTLYSKNCVWRIVLRKESNLSMEEDLVSGYKSTLQSLSM